MIRRVLLGMTTTVMIRKNVLVAIPFLLAVALAGDGSLLTLLNKKSGAIALPQRDALVVSCDMKQGADAAIIYNPKTAGNLAITSDVTAPTWVSTGLSFASGATATAYAETTHASVKTRTFTIAVAYKCDPAPTGTSISYPLWGHTLNTTEGRTGFGLYHYASTVRRPAFKLSNSYVDLWADGTLKNNSWHALIFSVAVTGDTVALSVDGSDVAAESTSSTNLTTPTRLRIAWWDAGSTGPITFGQFHMWAGIVLNSSERAQAGNYMRQEMAKRGVALGAWTAAALAEPPGSVYGAVGGNFFVAPAE